MSNVRWEGNSPPPPYHGAGERQSIPRAPLAGPQPSYRQHRQQPYSPIGDDIEHHADETQPLLPRRNDQADQYPRGKRGFPLKRLTLLFFILVLSTGIIAGPFITIKYAKLDTCPETDEMEHIRAEWDLEKHLHEAIVLEREEVYRLWQVEDANHAAKLEHWGEEDLEREEIRKEWRQEVIRHQYAEHGMEETRRKWQQEAVEHERDMEKMRRRWDRELIEHEREVRERLKRELEERQKMDLFWTDLEASHCARYETRVYTARLANVPDGFEQSMEACMETELSINGKMKRPTRCEERGSLGVYGFWEEDGDAACGTYFNWFKQLGCTAPGSGLLRYEMYMENLRPGDSWETMCSTTPATFKDRYFAHPDLCFQRNGGTYGWWDVRDNSCW